MQRSINLGGWFIPEKWMSPSLFAGTEAVDLWTLLETKEGPERYRAHLDNWITEADFAWLAAHGVEFVRLPVGYWAVQGDEVYPDTSEKLAWAFRMAEKYALKVLLDFHAAKGSQNGRDHSGRIGPVDWWHYESEAETALLSLAQTYGALEAFWGIELINEPRGGRRYFALLRFYRRVYSRLQAVLPAGKRVVFHDGFLPLLFTGALRAHREHPVAMDMHLYGLPVVFARSQRRYIWWQQCYFRFIVAAARVCQPVIIGEWSGVLPQKLFDQYPESEHMKLVAANIARQEQLFKKALRTSYWNYKTEAPGVWNFRSLVEMNVLRSHAPRPRVDA